MDTEHFAPTSETPPHRNSSPSEIPIEDPQAQASYQEMQRIFAQANQHNRSTLNLSGCIDDQIILDELARIDGWEKNDPTREYIRKGLDIAEAYATPEEEPQATTTRYVTIEPHAITNETTVFLPHKMRTQYGVLPGDSITIRSNDQVITATVARPQFRDNHTLESAQNTNLRVSEKVLTALQIPASFATTPEFNSDTKELSLSESPPSTDIVKIQRPRDISSETISHSQNMCYLSLTDQEQFGVKPGDTITVRFGELKKTVIVATHTSPENTWTFSEDIVSNLCLNANPQLRTRFDKRNSELSFGPTLGLLAPLSITKDGRLSFKKSRAKNYADSMIKHMIKRGGIAYFIDPREQSPAHLEKNYVLGWTARLDESGELIYSQRYMPLPDMVYENDASRLGRHALKKWAAGKEVLPEQPWVVSSDKLWVDYILSQKELAPYRLEALTLSGTKIQDLEGFFDRHPRAVLKPQIGRAGKDVFVVTKTATGYTLTNNVDAPQQVAASLEKSFTSIEELHLYLQEQADVTQTSEVSMLSSALQSSGLNKFMLQEMATRAEVTYTDPFTHEKITGSPEPRVVLSRGPDGTPRVVGTVARMFNHNSSIPHNMDPFDVTAILFAGDKQKARDLLQEISRVSIRLMEQIESEAYKKIKQRNPRMSEAQLKTRSTTGEMIVDFLLTADGSIKVLEPNVRASQQELFDTGKYNTDARDLQYDVADFVLAQTDFI